MGTHWQRENNHIWLSLNQGQPLESAAEAESFQHLLQQVEGARLLGRHAGAADEAPGQVKAVELFGSGHGRNGVDACR